MFTATPGANARQAGERADDFGVRVLAVIGWELDREQRTVSVDGQPVAVKVGRLAGEVVNVVPEHEDVGSGAPAQIGVDSEALTMDPPVVFVSRPGALRVRLPRHAVQLSPAARTVQLLSGSTIAELGRVAAGQLGTG